MKKCVLESKTHQLTGFFKVAKSKSRQIRVQMTNFAAFKLKVHDFLVQKRKHTKTYFWLAKYTTQFN